MTRLYLIIFLGLCIPFSLLADKGIFDAYVIINPSSYIQAPSFDGNFFGSFAYNGTLTLNGGEVKSWENNGDNNQEAYMYYRVYEANTTAPGFTEIHLNGSYSCLAGGGCNYGDEKRDLTNANINLISLVPNATSNKNYIIEVFFKTTGSSDSYYSNNNANYKATFTKLAQPLPIIFNSFDINVQQGLTTLLWSTRSESNNDYFDILYSKMGKDFQVIGTVKGSGNSNTIQQYNFTHYNPSQGRSFYRLRQVDFDGKFEYSPVRSATSSMHMKEFSMVPNPATNIVTIIHDGSTSTFDIDVKDMSGRSIATFKDYSSESLDVSNLSPGIYIVMIKSEGFVTTQRLIKE